MSDDSSRFSVGDAVDLGEHAGTLSVVLDSIYKCYRMGFGRSYDRCRGELMWRNNNGHARYTLCLVGGGCLCNELVARLSRALPLLNMASIDVEILRVPDSLTVLLPSGEEKAIR